MLKHISKLQYALLVAALALYAAITLFGFNALSDSPYSGLRLTPRGNTICVERVDPGSPADLSGVQAGDELSTVNGDEIPPIVFLQEPDHIRWKKDRVVFRYWQQRFNETVGKGTLLKLGVRRNDKNISVSLTPTQFPLSRALTRNLPAYGVAWASMALALLVLRKKQNEVAWQNVMMWYVTGIVGITLTPYAVRDIAFPTNAMLTLSRINRLAMFFSVFAWINFILVFPRRRKVLDVYPRMREWLYAAAGLLTLLDLAGAFEDTFVLSYSAVGAAAAFIAFLLIYDLVKEQDPLFKKQIQWVVFGIAVSGIFLLVLHFIPLLIGIPALSDEAAYLLLAPAAAGFAFAITRYRLMDIDTIVDQTIIFGLTILILEGLELAFLGLIGPRFPVALSAPYLSIAAILLIVFFYLPLRNRVKKKVERLFKRGVYDSEEELRKLTLLLGACDQAPAMEKFSAFVRALLGAGGVRIVMLEEHAGSPGRSGSWSLSGDTAPDVSAEPLIDHFQHTRASSFGYEIAECGVRSDAEPAGNLAAALFVPFFVADECAGVAVLLPKRNGTVYSKKDRSLLEACAAACSHALAAERKRNELEQERARLAREIHDGISSEFSGILSYGEKGGQGINDGMSAASAEELFSRIVTSSRRGLQELRNIIWALNTERQSFGYLAAQVKRFASDFMDSGGITVSMQNADGRDDLFLLQPALSLTLFRIVQELCHNTLKYANAACVTITLQRKDGLISLSFADDGKGYDLCLAPAGTGNGLRNIRKRVDEIGGTMQVATAPGKGTAVSVLLPIQ